MHFTTGTVVDISDEAGQRTGRLRVGGALARVDLSLLPQARVGDTVLAHAGVGLSVVRDDAGARVD